jgi:ClpP class serine protease
MHKLLKLTQAVYNTPHLVTPTALQPIVEYLRLRNEAPQLIVLPQEEPKEKEEEPLSKDGYGELLIDGVLTYKPIQGLCGPTGTSYQGILEQAASLIESGVHTLLMVFSSPGGEASHCFTTANELRRLADESETTLIAYVDEMACSAALALSVIADEVIIHPSASTGSIGCVVALMDASKAMAQAGLKPVYISSAPGKVPFEADGSFSEKFLTDIQSEVTRLGNQFAAHVSAYTGIELNDISTMDAKVFNAEKALELGLVTAIMDHSEFLEYLSSKDARED